MTVGLYNGDKNCCGVVTPSGPESIIMALLAYREKNKHIRNPQIIIPESAQPAYEKAALYLGLKIIKIPLNKKSF